MPAVVILIVGLIVGFVWLVNSCENIKREKAEAAASIEKTIIDDEKAAFSIIKELQREAEIERSRRLEADRRADAERKAEQARREAEKKVAAEKAFVREEEARKESERESELRDFAMTEAPAIWAALQKERAERISMDNRLKEIINVFGGDLLKAETDEAYLAVLRQRNNSIRRIRMGSEAIEAAFRLSVQSRANPMDETLAKQKMEALLRARGVFVRPSGDR